ncbi:EutP/PduV family microcompartment system protein [Fusibacter sp. 3D3]|uniref:EutP/PduV family microcompartment system protein n=1 Tax=Fusibacter sp. 3D3 TaxID=1048380 RepID=UPI000852B699|nr:EutP/PduV family microcompartment system protein [Fusibacter sp. 3D3]GAU75898.1 ethanolamine utilization protein similar to PduV [Fusibacter sp. 3D3]
MGKIIFMGKTGVGKTTLIQNLRNETITYKKTQATEFQGHYIDTPGEYIENPRFYNALITLSLDADVVALVQDVTSEECYFPPGFGDMFNIKVIGIMTKIDQAAHQFQRAEQFLKEAGAEIIYGVSACTNEGMDVLVTELKRWL